MAGADWQNAALARYTCAHGADGAVHCCISLDAEIPRHRGDGVLDHVCGFGQRGGGTLLVRANSAQSHDRRIVDERIAGIAGPTGAATGGTKAAA